MLFMYYYLSILSVAQQYIDLTRELVDTELTALMRESYDRAYSVVVR